MIQGVILFELFGLVQFCFSQIDTTLKDYFPNHAGNLHVYDDFVDVSHIYTIVSRDILDSTDASAMTYVVQRENTVGFDDTSDHYYTVDSLGNVIEYSSGGWQAHTYLILKANAVQGDSWRADIVTGIVAVVDTTYFGSYLGVNTTFKEISYYLITPTGFNLYNRVFALGLGVTFFGGGEMFDRHYLRAACVDGNLYGDTTVVSVRDNQTSTLPEEIILRQNYPNPFNPSTQIRFTVPKAADVTLKIFNVLGEEVATLAAGREEPGEHAVAWDASKMPSGVYFYRLSAGGFLQTKKMVQMK